MDSEQTGQQVVRAGKVSDEPQYLVGTGDDVNSRPLPQGAGPGVVSHHTLGEQYRASVAEMVAAE